MSAADKKWEELTLDEKLHELGFEGEDPKPQGVVMGKELEKRLHAALDELFNAYGILLLVEESVKPFIDGVIGVQPELVLRDVYALVHEEEGEEE